MKITKQELEAARGPKGGWTREALAKWGVPWPPPHGWKGRLLNGPTEENYDYRADMTTVELHDLLRKVVSSVVSQGHADDLYEFPEVLAYFGARMPDAGEISDHWKGRSE